MNPFQKNPFINNTKSTIKGYNPQFEEKNKIESIKINMAKLKQIKPKEELKPIEKKSTVSEKIEALRNINGH